MLLTVRTHSFSWSNEVNNDFKLFHIDIHIYIKYSTLIKGDKHWNYIKSLHRSYINLDIFVVDVLNHFPRGTQCFNDSDECYNNSYI